MIDDVLERSAAEHRDRKRAARTTGARDAGPDTPASPSPPLILRVDGEMPPFETLEAVASLAERLERTLRLVSTLGDMPDGLGCPDPVDREVARQARLAELQPLLERLRREGRQVESRVIDRFERGAFDDDGDGGPPLLGFLRDRGELPWHRDRGARDAVDAGASILIVPHGRDHEHVLARASGPLRLLVPLDGSPRAEAALSPALRLARWPTRTDDADASVTILLAHVAPTASVTRVDPPDADALALAERLGEHNRQAAVDYLATLKRRHTDQGARLATRLLRGDTPRALLEAVTDGDIDLVVMAMAGAGDHVDVPAGSVALHLAAHAPVPVLLIGSDRAAVGAANADEPASAALSAEATRRPVPPPGHG